MEWMEINDTKKTYFNFLIQNPANVLGCRCRADAKQTDAEIQIHVHNQHIHKLFIYWERNKPGEKSACGRAGDIERERVGFGERNWVRVGKNINVDHINGPDRVNCK